MSKTLKQHGVIIGLYIVIVLLMSLPAIFSIGDELIGKGGDPWQVVWRFDNKLDLMQENTASGGIMSAIKSEFGGGQPRLVNLSVWPWMWAHLWFGEPVGYNIIWLLSFVLSGYGMFLLVSYLFHSEEEKQAGTQPRRPPRAFWRKRCESPTNYALSRAENMKERVIAQAPAFIAGLVYMLMPFHVAHSLGHFGAMQIQWIPLVLLAFFMLLDKLTVIRAVMFLLLVTIQAWTEHQYMLWLGVFMGWFFIYSMVKNRQWRWSRKALLYLLVLGTLLAVTVAVPYWPTIQLATQSNSLLDLGEGQLIRFSADPIAYFVPASFHTIWGRLSNSLFGQHFTGNIGESTLFLGLLPTLLILFYHQKIPKKQKKFWLITALLFGVISLGPKLHLMGYVTKIFMPYAVIKDLPVFNAVRTVVRAAVLVNVAWVVLLGWVLKTQIKRSVSVLVVVFIVLIEFLFWPMPTMSFQMPKVYQQIKEMKGEAIIEIPTATNYMAASKALYGSRVHQKKLINNIALERADGAEAYLEVRSMPALRQLLYLRTDHILEGREDFFRQDMVETLSDVTRWLDVRQILVHQDSLSERQKDAVIYLLEKESGLKRVEVEDVWLYELEAEGRGDGIFVARDDGWKRVALNKEKNEITAEIEDEAKLTVYNVNKDIVTVSLSWIMSGFDNRKLDVVSEAELYSSWDKLNEIREVQILVEPGSKVELELINTGKGSIRIEEPTMSVLKKN